MLFWTNFVNWINGFIENSQLNNSRFIHEWFIDEPDISVMNMIRGARVDFSIKTCFCLFNKLYRPVLCYFYGTLLFASDFHLVIYYFYSIIYFNGIPTAINKNVS